MPKTKKAILKEWVHQSTRRNRSCPRLEGVKLRLVGEPRFGAPSGLFLGLDGYPTVPGFTSDGYGTSEDEARRSRPRPLSSHKSSGPHGAPTSLGGRGLLRIWTRLISSPRTIRGRDTISAGDPRVLEGVGVVGPARLLVLLRMRP